MILRKQKNVDSIVYITLESLRESFVHSRSYKNIFSRSIRSVLEFEYKTFIRKILLMIKVVCFFFFFKLDRAYPSIIIYTDNFSRGVYDFFLL